MISFVNYTFHYEKWSHAVILVQEAYGPFPCRLANSETPTTYPKWLFTLDSYFCLGLDLDLCFPDAGLPSWLKSPALVLDFRRNLIFYLYKTYLNLESWGDPLCNFVDGYGQVEKLDAGKILNLASLGMNLH